MQTLLFVFFISSVIPASAPAKKDDDEDWVKLPNKCEVCKYVTVEMKSAFEETGKKQEKPKNDIRFIEVMETICQRLMHYNLHKERTGSNRFAKCYVMMEKYEDVIEDWYRKHQDEDLTTYLCEKHVLKGENQGCLDEVWTSKKGETAAIDEKKKKKKKGTNNDKENNKKKSKGRKRRRVTWRLREGTEQRILHLTKTSRKRSPSPMIKVIYERDARIQCAVDWLLNTVPGKMCTAFHNGMKTT